MHGYEILIPITADFQWELKPFYTLFKKFWGDAQITVLSDRDPQIPELRFVKTKVPIDVRRADWSGTFTNNLLAYLKNDCATEFLIIMMADYWIADKVNLVALQSAVDYMASHRNVIRLQISNGMVVGNDDCIDNCGDAKIYNPPVFLRGSLIPGLWSKQQLIKHLPKNLSMWGMEIELSKIINKTPNLHSWIIVPHPIAYEHCISTSSKRANLSVFPMALHAMISEFIPLDFIIT